ncbi:glycosyltransferase family 2 protein [Antarctobacter heliothermus]|uniref:Glycosyltransferase involved in cell wall bisynthesis n=1 Tax=Antarctobacter heliothermus TaxID=74033 RepID=A0A239E1P3_9RHOB|nr:glycosyltransferase [Antarctobacter heliothermus]SNS38419.1 Glycosyltransferase involved in cell wall bisynthesis [Antarctobacter heliothermus]
MGTGVGRDMDQEHQSRGADLSVIVPASNEAALIGGCLKALLTSRISVPVEVIVVANGCVDDTALVARSFAGQAAERGWRLQVIERAEGGKPGALNAGDAAACGAIRVYLDADVTVTPDLLGQLATVLDVAVPRYASGQVDIAATTVISRAYARIWRRVPFMRDVVPGCGLFAVNAAGRARWGGFPGIIADDVFVRLQFAPQERFGVPAAYRWPIAEGMRNLIKVRRRQNAGVAEVAARFPGLIRNEDKPAFPAADKLRIALGDPLGFLIYAGVALAVKLTRRSDQDWSRGR